MSEALMASADLSPALCAKCGAPVDGPAPGARPCPTCAEHVHGRFCLHCGTEVATGHVFGVEHHHGPTWRRALKVAGGPLAEYVEHARSIVYPSRLVHEIRSERFTGIEVFSLWVAAAAMTALISAFLPNPMPRIEIPIVAEVLEAALTMAVTVLVYAPLHLIFRRGHRNTSFRQYIVTTLTIGALLYPWIALGHGLLMLGGVREPSLITGPLTMAFYVRVYSELYGRSAWRTAAWLIPCLLGMMVGLLALVAAILFVAQKTGLVPAKQPSAAVAPSRD